MESEIDKRPEHSAMDRLRISCGVLLLAALTVPFPGQTLAQSDICMRLEARLTALDSRAGDFDESRALEKQIGDQREELDRATAEARRAGCMGAFFQRLRAKPGCGPMMASVNRMRANLNRLTGARSRSDDRFGGGAERRELVRALAANQCGSRYEDYAQPARRGGFFASLFGRHLFRDRGWEGGPFGNGTFRSLCVRVCDGYYFPISFTTVQSRFARDEQLCRSMCPGTEVALYVHRNPGEESEAMVSLAGEPYVALPRAFRYRQEYDPTCSCGQMTAATVAASEPVGFLPTYEGDPWGFTRGTGMPERLGSDPPMPLLRPAAGEDPETLANRTGALVPEAVASRVSAVAGLAADGERHVRIVGPSYFYAQ
jgi:hypothetical protein